jgi:hypothetical protein
VSALGKRVKRLEAKGGGRSAGGLARPTPAQTVWADDVLAHHYQLARLRPAQIVAGLLVPELTEDDQRFLADCSAGSLTRAQRLFDAREIAAVGVRRPRLPIEDARDAEIEDVRAGKPWWSPLLPPPRPPAEPPSDEVHWLTGEPFPHRPPCPIDEAAIVREIVKMAEESGQAQAEAARAEWEAMQPLQAAQTKLGVPDE